MFSRPTPARHALGAEPGDHPAAANAKVGSARLSAAAMTRSMGAPHPILQGALPLRAWRTGTHQARFLSGQRPHSGNPFQSFAEPMTLGVLTSASNRRGT